MPGGGGVRRRVSSELPARPVWCGSRDARSGGRNSKRFFSPVFFGPKHYLLNSNRIQTTRFRALFPTVFSPLTTIGCTVIDSISQSPRSKRIFPHSRLPPTADRRFRQSFRRVAITVVFIFHTVRHSPVCNSLDPRGTKNVFPSHVSKASGIRYFPSIRSVSETHSSHGFSRIFFIIDSYEQSKNNGFYLETSFLTSDIR